MIRRIERINLPSALWMLSLLTLSGLIVVFCFIAASSLEREAIARQQVRADKIAVRIEEKFLIIEQLVRTMAALVAPMRSRPQVERLLETVLGSTDGQFVYGVGVWFEPYVFSPQERYFGPYVHRAAAGGARTILTYEWTTPSYDFHSHAWYRTGLLARDSIAFVEPYFDTDHVYISSVKAILGDDGEPIGVASVDVLRPQIHRFITGESQPNDEMISVATRRGVLVAHPELATILAWARGRDPAPANRVNVTLDELRAFEAARVPRRDTLPTLAVVPRLGWTVTIATDRRALFADARYLRWGAVPALALLWAGALGLYLSRRRAKKLKDLACEVKRGELVQRRSAELQAILDNMVDSVVTCDASRNITLMNQSAHRLFAMDPGESSSFEELLVKFHVRRADGRRLDVEEMPIVQALSRGEIARGYLIGEVPGRSGEVHVHTSAAPIRNSAGQIVAAVSVIRDVTSTLELEHLKDQFLEVTAHELKTPITIMKSYAQLALREGEGLPAPLRKKLEGINRGADRIDRILHDLLDVSQAYLGRLQLVLTVLDLRELVEQVTGRFGVDQSKHRVRVRAERSAMIRGDRRRLENVVSSLLDNAVRYSPDGGDIEVSLTVAGEEAVVTLEDHGIGIPAKGQSRIFERFYRAHSGTDHDHGGLGVGLYIAKQLVQQLGGRMWFLSDEGGSRFMFSLPLAGERGQGS